MRNILGVIALAGSMLYIFLFYALSSRQSKTSMQFLAKESQKVILAWSNKNLGDGWHNHTLPWKCGSCKMTQNKIMVDDANVGAIVFNYKVLEKERLPDPSKRRSDQLYVWMAGESPPNLLQNKRINLTFIDAIGFNATSTYRKDSDFPNPYGIVWNRLHTKKTPNKTKLAVAVVSDCRATAGAIARLKYLKKFQKHFPLDGYGRCFRNKLRQKDILNITKQYKFYFAFENSYHCRDYITEKLTFYALQSYSVPVVWGATKEDYEARIPPGSFIFVEDYQPMEKLIEYLHYLDKNDTAYLQYFKWKEDIAKMKSHINLAPMCALCLKLNEINPGDTFQQMDMPIANFTTTNMPLSQWLLQDNEECFSGNITIK